MRTIAVIALTLAAIASQAQVFPTGPFITAPAFTENFDSITQGTYNTLSVFGSPAVASRIGTGGALVIRPFIPPVSVPNIMYGDNVDMAIKTIIPMRRFGGWFRTGVAGAISPFAVFKFYDASNNPIGGATVPMTTTWTWVGFLTVPKWTRVEIYGTIPGMQGHIGIDSMSMRPN